MIPKCPVCGYAGLTGPPVNFSICPSCGTEFGYDDHKRSHAELRRRWVATGAQWFSRRIHPPAGWDGIVQLIEAGYLNPKWISKDIPQSVTVPRRVSSVTSVERIVPKYQVA